MIACVLLTGPGCTSIEACGERDRWTGPDKRLHLVGSAIMGAGGTLLASQALEPEEAAAVGFTGAMAAGLGKELYDGGVRQTCFSWKDLFWDFLGASLGATAAAVATD